MYKSIEIEGKKVLADDAGEALKNSKGEYIPYVEQSIPDVKDLDLEALSKANPTVAKMIEEHNANQLKLKEIKDAEEAKALEDAKKNGDFQKLLEDATTKNKTLEETLKTKDEQIGKYRTSVEGVVDNLLKQIPDDKKTLIPEKFSPREKLEYITQNSASLGVTTTVVPKQGDKVPDNDKEPVAGQQAILMKKFTDLMDKKDRSSAEDLELSKLATEIKNLPPEEKK